MTRLNKALAVLCVVATGFALAPSPASAQPFRGYGYYGYRGYGYGYRGFGPGFFGGALLGLGVGAVVGAAVAPRVVYAPPPVVYAPPPVVYARPAYGYYGYGY